jgi:signal transduction histidine kinase
MTGGGSLRVRLTAALLVAALVPVVAAAILAASSNSLEGDAGLEAAFIASIAGAAFLALALGAWLGGSIAGQVRGLASQLDLITAGQDVAAEPIWDDDLGRLAERQNELARVLGTRNRRIERVGRAVGHSAPGISREEILERAAADAALAFGLVDARVIGVDTEDVPDDERVPGEPIPVRVVFRAGPEAIGVLAGSAPASARWEQADQQLLELFAAIVGASVRSAELFARVEAQNEQLLALDAAKDDFLRAVSHNLQTPLARIRAYADQLADESSDRRPAIISEQSDRLSRMVRQVLTVSHLDAGVLRPMPDVFAPAPAIRRAWEALGDDEVAFELEDSSRGWLAVADPGDVDQVLWALLDNALKYGGGGPIRVVAAIDEAASRLAITVADSGPGVPEGDREELFGRFVRGRGTGQEGTGLGLYVARSLARVNEGDLRLEPANASGRGAAFTLLLPAESPTEA